MATIKQLENRLSNLENGLKKLEKRFSLLIENQFKMEDTEDYYYCTKYFRNIDQQGEISFKIDNQKRLIKNLKAQIKRGQK